MQGRIRVVAVELLLVGEPVSCLANLVDEVPCIPVQFFTEHIVPMVDDRVRQNLDIGVETVTAPLRHSVVFLIALFAELGHHHTLDKAVQRVPKIVKCDPNSFVVVCHPQGDLFL